MKIGIIGDGAIGSFVRTELLQRGHIVRALLLPPERLASRVDDLADTQVVADTDDLPDDIEHMIDCAGHEALRFHGPSILRRGTDLTTVSIGALADQSISLDLKRAADAGDSFLYLASGAIGALDCLRAARTGRLREVTYVGRKPPQSWKGSAAENRLSLDEVSDAAVHFEGCARDAAITYPKNANVAAAVALSGIGFDDTQVQLIADPNVSENIHEIHVAGEFGRFDFAIRGHSLPDNPRSSALAAMSVVSRVSEQTERLRF